MATIKSFTDISQSKKLAKILPLESADMFWLVVGNTPRIHVLTEPLSNYSKWENYPCWSLATLLSVLPDELEYNHFLVLSKDGAEYCCCYEDIVSSNSFKHITYADNPTDACVSMIEKLHELNLL